MSAPAPPPSHRPAIAHGGHCSTADARSKPPTPTTPPAGPTPPPCGPTEQPTAWPTDTSELGLIDCILAGAHLAIAAVGSALFTNNNLTRVSVQLTAR